VKQHLERNAPAGGPLSNSVNDPHPAATNLAQQFIVAELARHRVRRRGICGVAGKMLDQVDVGKVIAQGGDVLRVFGQESLLANRFASVDPCEVIGQDGGQAIGIVLVGRVAH
jgi:hypothetical protein